MTSLFQCPSCRRHIRDEDRCPFCGVDLDDAPAARASGDGKRGLRRAVMVAATAALATGAAVDCSSTVETHQTGGTTSGGGSGQTSTTSHVASTSVTTTSSGSFTSTSTATGTGGSGTTSSTGNTGGFLPPYGAPPV